MLNLSTWQKSRLHRLQRDIDWLNEVYFVSSAILKQKYLLKVFWKLHILWLSIKSRSIITKVNLAKNSSKTFFKLAIVIPNLRSYKKRFDCATLLNLPNIFFKFWIIPEKVKYVLTNIKFALTLITLKPWLCKNLRCNQSYPIHKGIILHFGKILT